MTNKILSELNIYKCDSDQVVIIIHGASEGCGRYHELATKLSANYNVITYNHPGHETGEPVDFTKEQILEKTRNIIKYAQSTYAKVTIFAHSMGSLVVRNLTDDLSYETQIILSGAPVLSVADKLSGYVAWCLLSVLPKNHVSLKLNYLTFDQKSNRIGLTDKTWISSDSQVVKEFISSDKYNKPFTNRGLKALLSLSFGANNKKLYKQLNNYRVLLVSGLVDSFTGNGQLYYNIVKQAPNVTVKVYPNSYHEIHNDIDRNQLYKDIRKFIDKEENGKN